MVAPTKSINMPANTFRDYVLDQLSTLPEVRARSMFGGYGLYQSTHFFGIIAEGRLYFKTDDQTSVAYMERGMGPFIYEKSKKTISMRYYEVPPEVLEDRVELTAWANRAVEVAARQPKAK